ncbi:hypothetical protein [Nocardia thailandica]|uniref:hypothetical protein n=1 Tax=Nocardia thailandica TaxID=257275 RepID=UPI0012F7B1AC|nr:hypothetical protein [Nocardia thailandica]
MTTTLESEVLDALQSGAQLTSTALARCVNRPRRRVRRAANALRRQGLVFQYHSGAWVASPAGRVAR